MRCRAPGQASRSAGTIGTSRDHAFARLTSLGRAVETDRRRRGQRANLRVRSTVKHASSRDARGPNGRSCWSRAPMNLSSGCVGLGAPNMRTQRLFAPRARRTRSCARSPHLVAQRGDSGRESASVSRACSEASARCASSSSVSAGPEMWWSAGTNGTGVIVSRTMRSPCGSGFMRDAGAGRSSRTVVPGA